jgi:two-component system chemotaxis response regulator CheB
VIKVLIVDDSAVLRQSTKFILESDPDLKVIGEAGNGLEAIALADRLRPDVITMDIRMPKMDGLEAIRQIMAEKPAPIVVVTSADLDGEMNLPAQATKLGAVSVLRRPSGVTTPTYKTFAATLIRQVKLMSSVKLVHRVYEPKFDRQALVTSAPTGRCSVTLPGKAPVKTEIAAVGSSTGGPAALYKVLSSLPAAFPLPIVIVQHISFGFVAGLADWLNEACAIAVKVGQDNERLRPGIAYLAPDEHHLTVDRFGKINLNKNDPVGGFRPAVTVMFQSVAQAYGAGAIGALLTGMGSDGAQGMLAMKQAGAITLAQDEESCVVFGMPKEAIALGAAQHVVPLDKMAAVIQSLIVPV